MLNRRATGGPLSEFDSEQKTYSWISLVAYGVILATCWIPESAGWVYAFRALGPCWLAISGSWEVVAYAARFNTLFRP